MPIVGIGTDILSLTRIHALVQRRSCDHFAKRILSDREARVWETYREVELSKKVRFLAVRWAVKEATYKALQPLYKLTWKNVSLLQDPSSGSNKPWIAIDSRLGCSYTLHCSISHDGDYVTSFVVAEK
ncbi:4'-phosphopantetheinyl transferase [Sistotremastrum niveocremeum HHB9708]|uniref:4'-phosphopantetheinyl transferase n=2 Tax=Sistotremastraceae TaxID=3402574 RepID=A0A164ZR17_9AGAM|nr:4'-phosphopantetheinyl transferase [Sistotremastrum niveocremeum HHB9708]KZT36819.1 4'-phosphopantetheinyl transferase [Sistotremastrum suecicum HHB10207 ss-3]